LNELENLLETAQSNYMQWSSRADYRGGVSLRILNAVENVMIKLSGNDVSGLIWFAYFYQQCF
jgi:hypothetical protein